MTQENDDLVAAILTLGTLRGDAVPAPTALVLRFTETRDALRDMRAAGKRA